MRIMDKLVSFQLIWIGSLRPEEIPAPPVLFLLFRPLRRPALLIGHNQRLGDGAFQDHVQIIHQRLIGIGDFPRGLFQ